MKKEFEYIKRMIRNSIFQKNRHNKSCLEIKMKIYELMFNVRRWVRQMIQKSLGEAQRAKTVKCYQCMREER